ncbi:MAG TPA: alpha/beta hydrolase family protein [Terriglobales bacterium]
MSKLAGTLCRLAAVSFLLALQAHAQSRVECSVVNSHILGDNVHYCVLLPPNYSPADAKHPSQRFPILYFLHGLGDNEQTLFKTGGLTIIDDFREQHKVGDFLIVTPEAKASFYVNTADGKVRYSDFFLQEFIPYIETKYRVERDRNHRAITGISMGGYGALRFAFAHPELFSAVSAQSAALMTESPAELNAGLHSGSPIARMLSSVFGDPINVPHWKENDPLLLAKQNQGAIRRLAIYFNCGDQDEYKFETGATKLHVELQSENVKHEFHIYPGDHSAAYFLSHLAEVFEFHTQAFKNVK